MALFHHVFLGVLLGGVIATVYVANHGASIIRQDRISQQQRTFQAQHSSRRTRSYGNSPPPLALNLDFEAMAALDDTQWLTTLGQQLFPFWQDSVKTELQNNLDPFFSRISQTYNIGKADLGICIASTDVHYDFGKTTGLSQMDITQLTLREGSAIRMRRQTTKEEHITTWSGDFDLNMAPSVVDTNADNVYETDLNTNLRSSFAASGCSIHVNGEMTGSVRTAKPRVRGLVSVAGSIDESKLFSRVNVTGVYFPENLVLEYDFIHVGFDNVMKNYDKVLFNVSQVAKQQMADQVQKVIGSSLEQGVAQRMMLDVRMPACFKDYATTVQGISGTWSSLTSSLKYGWSDLVDSSSSWLSHEKFKAEHRLSSGGNND